MDGGEPQDATKLSDVSRRQRVKRDAFTTASRLTGSHSNCSELIVLQASDKNINRYSKCSTMFLSSPIFYHGTTSTCNVAKARLLNPLSEQLEDLIYHSIYSLECRE